MANKLHEINGCEVCDSRTLDAVLDLGAHPMCDHLVPVGDPRVCREYPIEILYCETCCTAHQRFQVPKRELFPANYHYRSRFTADVLTGMEGLVDSCTRRFGHLAGKKALDIGCNDGSLLSFFKKQGAATYGIEPTDAAHDAAKLGHTVLHEYLTKDVASAFVAKHGHPDFITFTNVFAHIEDLTEVVGAVRRLMAPHTTLVIENHYLGAVLKGHQFDTFYHEHPRSYSYTSFVHIARSLETRLLDVEFSARYGGNIRVFMRDTRPADLRVPDRSELDKTERGFKTAFLTMRDNIAKWRAAKPRFLDEQIKAHGKLIAKAFPGRAAILVKLLGLDERKIEAVYEKPGSLKIGHYLPGTRIPIRSDDELFARPDKERPILNLAWHIQAEIEGYLREHGWKGPVYDILSASDFADR